MISSIRPERQPNGDFGGRSFQGVTSTPPNLRGSAPSFPGAPNVPGSTLGVPEILRDTPGRRSNVTIQKHYVVPKSITAKSPENDLGYISNRNANLAVQPTDYLEQPGVLCFFVRGDPRERRLGASHNVEQLTSLASWNYLSSEVNLPRQAGESRQRLAITGDEEIFTGVTCDIPDASVFGLDDATMALCPFLVWAGAMTGTEIRGKDEKESYDNLAAVTNLWNFYSYSDGMLSEEKMGKYVPAGVVLYKYSTEGANKQAEFELDDMQHSLYNIVIQGHAMVTSWAVHGPGENVRNARRLVTMPRDVLYVVIVAKWTTNESGGTFSHFRAARSTSEELNKIGKNRATPGTNVDLKANEVIVGAWRIGSVIDNAASRTAPSVFATAPQTPPQAMGLTVSIGIKWVTSYALHDMYTNVPPDKAAAAASEAAAAAAAASKAPPPTPSSISARPGPSSSQTFTFGGSS